MVLGEDFVVCGDIGRLRLKSEDNGGQDKVRLGGMNRGNIGT